MDVFAALADPTRRYLVERLAREPDGSLTELSADLPVSRQAVAKHLGALRRRRARDQRAARAARPATACSPAPLRPASAWIDRVGVQWDDRLDSPAPARRGAARVTPTSASRRRAGSRSTPSSSTARRRGVLDTVRRLGFLQIDPIATVATPQQLVLLSRLGRTTPAELDRLLWDESELFEWNAFIWPIESLPLLQRAHARRPAARDAWSAGSRLETNARVPPLRPARARAARPAAGPRARGPLRPRPPRPPLVGRPPRHRHARLAAPLRRGGDRRPARGQRVWDLAERWYPPDRARLARGGRGPLDEQRFRSLGVRLVRGELHVHPDADDGPCPTGSRCSRRSTG